MPNLLILLLGKDTLDVIDMIFLHKHICCKSEKGEVWYHGKRFFTENFKSFGTTVKIPDWLNSLSPSKTRQELLRSTLEGGCGLSRQFIFVVSYQIREVQCLWNWSRSKSIIKIVDG